MKTVRIEPYGWMCKIEECPPGFFMCEDQLCFMTEYHENKGDIIAYNSAGEYFVTRKIMVQPVIYVIEEEEC